MAKIDLNQAAYQYFGGIDLMKIEGVSHATVLTIMSEVGPDGFIKFETAKHFTSWLRLAPNNKISGGKVLSNKVPKPGSLSIFWWDRPYENRRSKPCYCFNCNE